MALPAFLDPIVTLPKQYKMILGVVGLCAIGAAAYFLLLGPGHERVAKLPRVVTVAEWKLAGTGRSKDSVHANLTLATYTYRPVGSPPVPKAAEAAERKK